MRVRIARLAQRDIREAVDWYEEQHEDLGLRFVEAVSRALLQVIENPTRFQTVHRNARRALAGRFPYGIYFVAAEDLIRVVAVVHLHRDARAWRRRLR